MAALIVLLAASLALLGLGLLGRAAPLALAALGVVGAVAALVAAVLPEASVWLGLGFTIDGVSAVPLIGVFLLAASGGVRPALAGTSALTLLAGDAVGLPLLIAAVVVLGGSRVGRFAPWALGLAAGLCLLVALLVALGGFFGVAAPVAAVLVAGLVAFCVPGLGGVLGAYLVARLLLDMPGPVTPGWWGGPVLLLGGALALLGAWRTGGARTIGDGIAGGGLAMQGVAVVALGAALLARGADLLPLASMAVAGSLLLLLAWGVWAGLLGCCAGFIEGACGSGLVRLGGVLRRAPALGLAMLAGLLSMAAVPVTPGFAGAWLAVQAVLGVGRSGGVGVLLLMAGVAALLGLVAALLGARTVRLAGLVLLGTPQSARAAALTEASRGLRLALAALVAVSVGLGVVPGLGLLLVQRGVLALAAGPMRGGGWFAIGLPDAPGYAAPAVLLLLAAGGALAGVAVRGPATRVAAWQGGFIEDGIGRGNAGVLLPSLARPSVAWGWAVLAGLALLLAALLGWAAR